MLQHAEEGRSVTLPLVQSSKVELPHKTPWPRASKHRKAHVFLDLLRL
jgi:hypothetical protein